MSTITATPAKAESASPDQLTVIRQRGVVRIGVSPDLPGISIRSNIPAGFKGAEASLALLVGKALLGHPTGVQLVGVDSPERLVKLQAGAIDLAIGQITITPQRQRLVDFSIPYVTAYEALLLPATSTISSLNQLNGQSVSVADGSASQPRYQKQWPLIRLVATPSVSGGLELLRRGAVVAWANDNTNINGMLSVIPDRNRYRLLDVGACFAPKPYGIAIRKGSPALLAWLNAFLEKQQSNGQLARLFADVNGQSTATEVGSCDANANANAKAK